MNLFDIVEGLSGENLCTSILQYLLTRSEPARKAFIGMVARKCELGPLQIGWHFACVRERPTTDAAGAGTGRVDLVLETGDAVIGVEAKLHAGFQPGQPEKYLAYLEGLARDLGNLRETEHRYLLVVLAPQSREGEIENRIERSGTRKHILFLGWEDLLGKLSGALSEAGSGSAADAAVLSAFSGFLKDRIDFVPRLQERYPHLRRWVPRGAEWHKELVFRIEDFLPGEVSRIGRAEGWIGCSFYPVPETKEIEGWCGFVAKALVRKGAKHGAELVIALNRSACLDAPSLRPVELDVAWGARWKTLHAWAVDFDETWSDPKTWREAFGAIVGALRWSPTMRKKQ